ncbi:MAG: hypothetical protein JXB48_09375 [Candidatus Latescibacteria bacterium]|nr:hypothetical protein [Candidatus Latescibacterota bacterium]
MVFILLVFFMFVPTLSSAEEITLYDLQGDWLNKEYYETLAATKSPRKAVQGIEYTNFAIVPDQENHRWLQIFNFHEGLWFTITGLQPNIEPDIYRILFHDKQEAGHATQNDRFYVQPGKPVNTIEWLFATNYGKTAEEHRVTFIHAEPDLQRLVNRTVLAGIYSDQNGRLFVFGENGVAQWPDTTFTYKVGLDYIFAECDYFYFLDEQNGNIGTEWYAFEWQGNKLYIYTTHFSKEVSELIERDEKPLYVLNPK